MERYSFNLAIRELGKYIDTIFDYEKDFLDRFSRLGEGDSILEVSFGEESVIVTYMTESGESVIDTVDFEIFWDWLGDLGLSE